MAPNSTKLSLPMLGHVRGKRSAVLDLQTEAGRAAMLKLAAKADVMLEAFRPGVAKPFAGS